MDGIEDAWVRVTDLNEIYDNGSGDKGVYIQDSGYEYDVRQGTIMMDSEDSLHQAICEYTPPMTRAEMFYLAKIYSEIYPFEVYNGGAIIPTSSFMTIEQTNFNADQNIAHFSPEELDPVCLNIGRILNVESYPMTAIEEEFKGVKDRLTRHRFYLTNAYKDDGCFKADYRQWNNKKQSFQLYKSGNDKDNGYCEAHSFCFNQQDRYPTMAAMRAPLLCALRRFPAQKNKSQPIISDTFNQEYADCPSPPGWSEPPINNKIIATRDEAKHHCQEIDAALTGFDSMEEFEAVNKKVKPQYPPGSEQAFPGYPQKFWGPKQDGIAIDDHYNLGAQSPCQNACDDVKNGGKHVASWDFGVAANNDFLNYMNHTGITWRERSATQFVSFRADYIVFHLHYSHNYKLMFFICGRSADLKPAERQTGQLSGK
ncbi:hypothetical protein CAEBREN_05393 [Caenorhabditis brenneri]|uniref:C-type lectin domain-containing protein n=1 Tax=Caenorhabditis brenneri TaxID=135651 RepID=G0MJT4_CAEBE|nr:hypothetical protein CAEBREN_05393 [Caenorhabditis brenneri]